MFLPESENILRSIEDFITKIRGLQLKEGQKIIRFDNVNIIPSIGIEEFH